MGRLDVSHLVDESVFYYYVDRFRKPQADIDFRHNLVERLRAFIFTKDDAYEALVYIGFGTPDQKAAIEEERRGSKDEWYEHPLEDDFLEKANEWLATDAGVIAVLNYDTACDGLILPLREAYKKRDDLPISEAAFIDLVFSRNYVEEEN